MTGAWVAKPHLVHVKGRAHMVTSRGLYIARDGRVFDVPVGFETDGASVPRALWFLYPPFGDDYENAAVLHDYVYQHAELMTEGGPYVYSGSDGGHISRGECDALMLEVMEVDGFRATGRRVVHAGVRAGGWVAWRRYRAEAHVPRRRDLEQVL